VLTWVQGQFQKEITGGEYFNGREIGRSDIMLTWPIDLMTARNWYVLTSVLVEF
jgi:hypothetical protein